ncbi:MAG: hypothetical protein NVS3B28_14790 [Candidatus Velthaea sp.]
MRIVSIGGGPAGLSFAIIAKTRRPDLDIVVYERNRADDTFGFGVVFSDATLDYLQQGDPHIHKTIDESAIHWNDIMLELRGESIRVGGNGFSAFARKQLLGALQARAHEVGVDVRYSSEVTDYATATVGADLVLGADGINSSVRRRFEGAFEPHVDTGRAKFIWFGTTRPFDCLSFVFEENEHGVFGVHAYPYDAAMNTFIVETDDDTWHRAGLDRVGEDELDPVQGDLASKAYCERLFARTLGTHALIGNFSRWGNFRTIRNAAWSHENVVLMGDAAHTAHFSVGSGTKMAMEDAIALADAFAEYDALPEVFAAYEAKRKPLVARIQRASWPSIMWWEEIVNYVRMPLEQFAFHFMSRSDRMTREVLRTRDPAFIERVDRWYAEQPAAIVPDRVARLRLADHAAARVDTGATAQLGTRLRREGNAAAIVESGNGREERIRLALFTDALRNAGGLPVFVSGDFEDDFVRTLVMSGRADGSLRGLET